MTNAKTIRKIRDSYVENKFDKIDELKALNRKVHRPVEIFAYAFGIIGSLILGTGMCLVMPDVVTGYMALGIAVGIVGIILLVLNFYIYKARIKRRKRKYAERIIRLSNEILNEN